MAGFRRLLGNLLVSVGQLLQGILPVELGSIQRLRILRTDASHGHTSASHDKERRFRTEISSLVGGEERSAYLPGIQLDVHLISDVIDATLDVWHCEKSSSDRENTNGDSQVTGRRRHDEGLWKLRCFTFLYTLIGNLETCFLFLHLPNSVSIIFHFKFLRFLI